jgi:hypothetical protein
MNSERNSPRIVALSLLLVSLGVAATERQRKRLALESLDGVCAKWSEEVHQVAVGVAEKQ